MAENILEIYFWIKTILCTNFTLGECFEFFDLFIKRPKMACNYTSTNLNHLVQPIVARKHEL